jgi:hypothetical protein
MMVSTSTMPTPTNTAHEHRPQRQLEVEPQPVERGRPAILEHEDHRRHGHEDPQRGADVEGPFRPAPFDLVEVSCQRALASVDAPATGDWFRRLHLR